MVDRQAIIVVISNEWAAFGDRITHWYPSSGGVKFCHYETIVINENSVIGKNVTMHHGCTLGCIFEGKHKGSPTLGNRVVMFPGSKVVGNVHVGNNVVIAANAVVTRDVPDNCIVGGIPAKVLSTDSSDFFIGRNDVVF